jgi:hypothetical protein
MPPQTFVRTPARGGLSVRLQAGPGGPGAALLRSGPCRSAHGPTRPGCAEPTDEHETTEDHPSQGSATRGASSSLPSVIDRTDRINPAARLDTDPGPSTRSRCHRELKGGRGRRRGSRVDTPGAVHEAARTTRKGRTTVAVESGHGNID